MNYSGISGVSGFSKNAYITSMRKQAYSVAGCTPEALIIAMWEDAVEGRPEALETLQAKRLDVKARHPKE